MLAAACQLLCRKWSPKPLAAKQLSWHGDGQPKTSSAFTRHHQPLQKSHLLRVSVLLTTDASFDCPSRASHAEDINHPPSPDPRHRPRPRDRHLGHVQSAAFVHSLRPVCESSPLFRATPRVIPSAPQVRHLSSPPPSPLFRPTTHIHISRLEHYITTTTRADPRDISNDKRHRPDRSEPAQRHCRAGRFHRRYQYDRAVVRSCAGTASCKVVRQRHENGVPSSPNSGRSLRTACKV